MRTLVTVAKSRRKSDEENMRTAGKRELLPEDSSATLRKTNPPEPKTTTMAVPPSNNRFTVQPDSYQKLFIAKKTQFESQLSGSFFKNSEAEIKALNNKVFKLVEFFSKAIKENGNFTSPMISETSTLLLYIHGKANQGL